MATGWGAAALGQAYSTWGQIAQNVVRALAHFVELPSPAQRPLSLGKQSLDGEKVGKITCGSKPRNVFGPDCSFNLKERFPHLS